MPPIAVITGASGGLGEEFARLCAADGYDLVLIARSKEALETLGKELSKTHGIHATAMAEDLSDASSYVRIGKKLEKLPVALLINNAGFGDYGSFKDSDPVRDASMIQVNVSALTALSRLVLPGMVQRKKGRILNVASTAAFQPGPLMAVYYATKAYVLSLSLALSEETRGSGVTITCLCPGPTATGFARHANMGKSRLFRGSVMDSKTVARIGYKACLRGKPLVTSGLTNKIGSFLTRLVPRIVAGKVARMAQSPM